MTEQLRNSTTGEGPNANSNTLQRIAVIWRDVFGKPLLAPDQNFFESGGSPELAVRLTDGIRAEFGQAVPPLALYGAPTPRSLANILTGRTPLRFSNALLMRVGDTPPPFFLLHGIGGSVLEFFDLVQHLNWPQPIYGLQARGTDGLEAPLDTIESMAGYHLEAIRRIQPRGPYLLCGYSLGGLVALEIARQLSETGQSVPLIAMIDSYPRARLLPLVQRLVLYGQRALHRLHCMVARGASNYPTYEQSRMLNERMCGPAIARVTEAAFHALRHYRPRPYPGKVRFFTAKIKTVFPADPAAAWAGLIHELSLETILGSHYDMLQTNAASLGSALRRYVASALDNGAGSAASLSRKVG